MKKSETANTLILLAIILMSFSTFAVAQRLPSKQKSGVRAPTDIKIDGKATEWDYKFQAYNIASRMFYTVSNDDENLYLTVYLNDRFASGKILQGGLTLTLTPPSKSAGDISVTYPAVPKKFTSEYDRLASSPSVYHMLSSDKETDRGKLDSVVAASNIQFGELYKIIQTNGIIGVDPLISIYNAEGIRVAASLNDQMGFTYELALPLKYLGETVNRGEKFGYNLKLNSKATVDVPGFQGMDPPFIRITADSDPDGLYYNYPTDFSGEYVLAKE